MAPSKVRCRVRQPTVTILAVIGMLRIEDLKKDYGGQRVLDGASPR